MTKALSDAKVPYIEVSHGDGLAGSSLQYGLSRTNEMELIEAAASVAGEVKNRRFIITWYWHAA